MARRVRIKDHYQEQRLFLGRTFAALVVIAVLCFALFGKLVWLQVIKHDYYFDLSQVNRVRLDPIPASRGLILDRNGVVLVENQPAYQLELIPEQVPKLEETLSRLVELGLLRSEELDQTRRTIRSRRGFDSVPIKLRLTDEEIGTFAVHRHEFVGVDLRARQTRSYPYGELGVHAFGYVAAISADDLAKLDKEGYAGTTLIGKLGVEAAYETKLHGKNGYQEILVNAQGRSVERQGAYEPDLRQAQPVQGEDLMLSIDLAAQRAAEEGLGAERGAVVAIDPANGDVLALASHPDFDPAKFSRGLTRSEYSTLTDNPDKPLINRALRGAYPSGSTVKPIIALAGLTSGMLDPEKREFCNGIFHLPGSSHLYREGRTGRHGAVNLVDSIARSCDIYFYALAAKLGVDRIADMMGRFGFGTVTGIDISGEKQGILPSPQWKKQYFRRPADQIWYPGETVNLGVGQGYLNVTPLQLAHMVSMIATRGQSFRPRLVTGFRTPDGTVHSLAPVAGPAASGIEPAQWDLIFQGMQGATSYGTAAAIGQHISYTIAGKTGTAQVYTVGQNERYSDKNKLLRDHSWFIAFAPVDKPRIAICVLVENGGFGASVAAPIARKVIDAYLLRGETGSALTASLQ